jgi:anti-anti-sigma factor
MSVESTTHGDVQILSIIGRLVEDTDVRALVNAVKAGLKDGRRKYVLDLAGVDWIYSAGVSALITVYRETTDRSGNLVLAAVTQKVKQILTITKLDRVFDQYDTVDDAVAALCS